MNTLKLVFKEMSQRGNQLVASLLAITLGIAVIVAVKNISIFSEKAVARELDTLGANVLILPKSAAVQDYYSADFQDEEIPEEYVSKLVNSDVKGLDNLSPKLSLSIELKGHRAILTGILPRNEFRSKAVWQGALGIFSRPEGCGTVASIPALGDTPQNAVRKSVIDDLDEDGALIGAEIAATLGLHEGGVIQIKEKDFNVGAVLPVTGTVDDSRIFAHLHTVQEIAGKKGVLNAIEIIGCCSEISRGLVANLNKLLPDAKVVTITQIVQTQIRTNSIMNKLSLIILVVIVIIGAASIANYMFANVYERRREIGIMMAMGAKPGWLVYLFLTKSLLIGLAGGVSGYVIGTLLAVILGPKLAGIPVMAVPRLGLYGIALSVSVSLAASIWPVIKAAATDPFIIIQED